MLRTLTVGNVSSKTKQERPMSNRIIRTVGLAIGIVYFIAFYEIAYRTARHQPRTTIPQITVAP